MYIVFQIVHHAPEFGFVIPFIFFHCPSTHEATVYVPLYV
jgi:hypothetical protein